MAEASARTVESGRSFQTARRHRAELLQAIHGFEAAVAAPAGEPAWRDGVKRRLAALRDRLAEHIVVTEGPDGLYAELLEHAPRLGRPVAGLVAEHGALQVLVDSLDSRLRERASRVEEVRKAASELLSDLSRHRQRGADLVYEAYATDIGGET